MYAPPPGFIDLPFTWAFDASVLTNGQNYQGLDVYLLGGFGDFLLRRVVGLDRVLLEPGTYLIKDRNNKPFQSAPIIANGAATEDLMIVPELEYPETGIIRFDLNNVTLSPGPQIAFQGSRRIPGVPNPLGEVHPKSFTYKMSANFAGTSGGPVTSRVLVTDYPFLLENLMIFQQLAGNATFINITDVSPQVALTIYDQDRVKISNIPILDIFYDGSDGGAFENGALVPPLYYRKDSQIQIDFKPVADLHTPPASTILVYLIGKQIYPC